MEVNLMVNDGSSMVEDFVLGDATIENIGDFFGLILVSSYFFLSFLQSKVLNMPSVGLDVVTLTEH